MCTLIWFGSLLLLNVLCKVYRLETRFFEHWVEICWCGSTVEQLICNQQVGGSIPSTSSNCAMTTQRNQKCKSNRKRQCVIVRDAVYGFGHLCKHLWLFFSIWNNCNKVIQFKGKRTVNTFRKIKVVIYPVV